ncbi:MAG: SHOCT domain-containing protein [Candidatus Cloacimonetes bacterium]|nr:SHOCT domain-containing protein [Candidatus Cloacimonadota bacterium]
MKIMAIIGLVVFLSCLIGLFVAVYDGGLIFGVIGISYALALAIVVLSVPSNKSDKIAELSKINHLRKSEAITEDEFQQMKNKLLY